MWDASQYLYTDTKSPRTPPEESIFLHVVQKLTEVCRMNFGAQRKISSF